MTNHAFRAACHAFAATLAAYAPTAPCEHRRRYLNRLAGSVRKAARVIA